MLALFKFADVSVRLSLALVYPRQRSGTHGPTISRMNYDYGGERAGTAVM